MRGGRFSVGKLAYAGIGASISLVAITLAFYIKNMSLTFNILASIGLMLPLSQKYYRESFLAYIAVSAIGAIYTTINILPFVLVTGGYTLLTIIFHEKKVKPYITYPVMIVWSCLVFFILYWVVDLLALDLEKLQIANWSPVWVYICFNLVFTVAFFVYDWVIVWTYMYLKQYFNKARPKGQ